MHWLLIWHLHCGICRRQLPLIQEAAKSVLQVGREHAVNVAHEEPARRQPATQKHGGGPDVVAARGEIEVRTCRWPSSGCCGSAGHKGRRTPRACLRMGQQQSRPTQPSDANSEACTHCSTITQHPPATTAVKGLLQRLHCLSVPLSCTKIDAIRHVAHQHAHCPPLSPSSLAWHQS